MKGIVCLFVLLATLLSCGPPPEWASAPVVQTIDFSSDELEIPERGAKVLPEASEAEDPSRIVIGFEDAAARRCTCR